MSVLKKNSARQRDQERARLIWLLTTDKAVTSTLLGKLTLAEQYDVGTLADDIAEVGALVAHLPPPDLADTLEALPSEERHALWRLVQDHERGQVLLEASENVWDDLIDEMSDRDILDALQTLDIDEQIYLVQHLPRNLTGRLLASLPADERARVRQVMHYEKNSVGAIMEFGVITVRPDVTLGTVQRYLRRLGKMPDNTDKLFVTSRDKTLLGELELKTILLNSTQRRVSEVMENEPMVFSPEDDAEKAARTFERDDLVSAAVVDSVGKLMGRLTVDEIVDVVYEETDNDLRALGGISAEDDVHDGGAQQVCQEAAQHHAENVLGTKHGQQAERLGHTHLHSAVRERLQCHAEHDVKGCDHAAAGQFTDGKVLIFHRITPAV